MSGPTSIVSTIIVGCGLGFAAVWTALDISKTPPVQPVHIEMRSDGSVYYEWRNNLGQPVDTVWSVTVINGEGRPHCSGSGLWNYPPELATGQPGARNPEDWTANDFVGGDCAGLQEGMQYFVSWTPVNGSLAPSSWPPEGQGVGIVLPPDN